MSDCCIKNSKSGNENLFFYKINNFLFFSATGIPEPQITWLKYGQPLGRGTHTGIMVLNRGREISIQEVYEDHQGRYECTALNEAGKDSKTDNINVQSMILIEIGIRDCI